MTRTLTIPAPPAEVTLLTAEQAARRLSIGRTKMFELLKSGEVMSVQIGRLRRIPIQALAAYAAGLVDQQHAA
jgi:excisionase family DNA binding protein